MSGSKPTLYEQLGGESAIANVVDIFYEHVLADPTVNPFFEHTDMEKQRAHQAKFISFALGGPNQYSGKSMERAHEGMNLQPEHFAAIAKHLETALRQVGVSQEDVQAVIGHVATLKDAILYK